MKNKKLYRSSTNKMISGVCGGLAEYLEMDATILRLLWALVIIFSGIFPGLLMYIVAAVIIPLEPTAESLKTASEENKV